MRKDSGPRSEEGGEVAGDRLEVDRVGLSDELTWDAPHAADPALEMTLSRDGFLYAREHEGQPWQVQVPRFLVSSNGEDSYESLIAHLEEVRDLGFTGVVFETSPVGASGHNFGPQVFPTKRELLRIMDEAHELGLFVVPQVPVWPPPHRWASNIGRWTLNKGLVRNWVRFFGRHPALGGWLAGNEMSCSTFFDNIECHPLRHWIRDAEHSFDLAASPNIVVYRETGRPPPSLWPCSTSRTTSVSPPTWCEHATKTTTPSWPFVPTTAHPAIRSGSTPTRSIPRCGSSSQTWMAACASSCR